MRRLARWSLNALTVMSLVPCVAVTALWVRSYSVLDVVTYNANDVTLRAFSQPGHLVIGTMDMGYALPGWQHTSRPATNWRSVEALLDSSLPNRDVRLGGVRWFSGIVDDMHGGRATLLILPHATAAAVFAIVPLIALARAQRARRRAARIAHSRCPACSYDLTGNVSGVCPECGRRS